MLLVGQVEFITFGRDKCYSKEPFGRGVSIILGGGVNTLLVDASTTRNKDLQCRTLLPTTKTSSVEPLGKRSVANEMKSWKQ